MRDRLGTDRGGPGVQPVGSESRTNGAEKVRDSEPAQLSPVFSGSSGTGLADPFSLGAYLTETEKSTVYASVSLYSHGLSFQRFRHEKVFDTPEHEANARKSKERHRKKKKQNKRGVIRGFSRWSRKRLLQTLAKVQTEVLGQCVFVSMTYHRDRPEAAKTDLDTFLKRLRRFDPSCAVIWKAELQKRGTPHFHLLIWGGSKDFRKDFARNWLKHTWNELVEPGDPYHLRYGVQIENLDGYKKVFAYLCKYLGKLDGEENPQGREIGRRWGESGDLPKEAHIEIEMEQDEIVSLKRLARRWLKSKGIKSTRFIKAVRQNFNNFLCIETPDFIWRYLETRYGPLREEDSSLPTCERGP